jgi:hypothetical protein
MPTFNNFEPYSYIRLLHAVPDAPAVDIYANDSIIARRLPYQGFTQYLKVRPGLYNIKIFPAGNKTDIVSETDIDIRPTTINTVAATGLLNDILLLKIDDPEIAIPPGAACIRFGHLSQEAPAVDITLPDGRIVFEDVSFEEVTDYICINPGTYVLQARVAGTNNVVLTVPNIKLTPDRFYSIYAVGLVEGEPSLQVLIPLDGNSYIDF